ncbi:MAG: hypothetical protein AAFP69_09605, partial [Planctomycetota bacterium]
MRPKSSFSEKQQRSRAKDHGSARRKRRPSRRPRMENLEQRHLLAAEFVPLIDPALLGDIGQPQAPRNIGTVDAVVLAESAETPEQRGLNDTFFQGEYIPLGNQSGQFDTIDFGGFFPPLTTDPANPGAGGLLPDFDTYHVRLQQGDIIDIAATGGVGAINLLIPPTNSTVGNVGAPDINELAQQGINQWLTVTANENTASLPSESPLQTVGNVSITQTAPYDGIYGIQVLRQNVQVDPTIPLSDNYTLGLRTYRPLIESAPIGAQQVIFLDFDGGIIPSTYYGPGTATGPSFIRFPRLADELTGIGLDESAVAPVIESIINRVEVDFHSNLPRVSQAGDFNRTGVPGEYGVLVLNSRDHVDPGFHPLVTRIFFGGTADSVGLPSSISQTLDYGNFSYDDVVYVETLLAQLALDPGITPRSGQVSAAQAIGTFMGTIASHEAWHSFGMRHTNNSDGVGAISDAGGGTDLQPALVLGLGPDQILGTADDNGPDGIFGTRDDIGSANPFVVEFLPAEGILGDNYVADQMGFALLTGTQGNTVAGNVFNDINGNGIQDNGEVGFGGITVFNDLDGDGVRDPGEQQ